jgi:spore germination cell wall hydrolase CwlJ-like protein
MNYFVLASLLCAALFAQSCQSTPIAPENLTIVNPPKEVLTERQKQIIHNLREEACLTEAIYYEAGNQSEVGKEAVALVIMNRVGARHRPKTVCGVIAQAHIVNSRRICQFSFWCEPKLKPSKQVWKESKRIAHQVLTTYQKHGRVSQYDTAQYYHAWYVNPKWATQKVRLGVIGDHIFYKDPDALAPHHP